MVILIIGFKMAYNQNIPQASDDPSQSQSQILGNFQEIHTDFANNHVSLTDATSADRGKHKFLQMPSQSSAPTTGSTEGALYTKTVSSVVELFYRFQSNGTEYQLTGNYNAASSGHITFPGGLIMNWGLVAVGAGPTQTFTFDQSYSSAVYSILLTDTSIHNVSSYISSVSITEGTITGSGNVYYIAIGL
jgi:hypothetical protein